MTFQKYTQRESKVIGKSQRIADAQIYRNPDEPLSKRKSLVCAIGLACIVSASALTYNSKPVNQESSKIPNYVSEDVIRDFEEVIDEYHLALENSN